MANGARPYVHWEEAMLAEYLVRFLPMARVINRQRLGPDGASYDDPSLNDAERKMLGAAFRRWADAVVIDAGTFYVIETAMVPDPRDISLVQTYLMLVDHTPELADYASLPRKGRLVWGVDDAYSRAVALNAGLEVVIYRPTNWAAWLAAKREMETRKTRAAVTLRGKVPLPTPR